MEIILLRLFVQIRANICNIIQYGQIIWGAEKLGIKGKNRKQSKHIQS